jgi:dolichyl-diphosphooligosaccharide--protein glycosyltransferase
MGSSVKIAYVAAIIALIMIPLFYPPQSSWTTAVEVPTAIANGGSVYRIQQDDWIDATQWIAENTEEDAVIAAWWDYGYWITTLGERTTLADNATINQTRIETIAKMFSADEQSGLQIAQDLQADYILVYVVGQKIFEAQPNANVTGAQDVPVYALGQGGEESKKNWIMRIAGYDEFRYIENDGFTPKEAFWDNTFLGRLIPFEGLNYVQISGGALTRNEAAYERGLMRLYSQNVKYPADGGADQPLHLVYASPSFEESSDIITGVLIYEVNHDYVPTPRGDPYAPSDQPVADMTSGPQVAEVETAQGTFTIEFFPNAAPETVQNFIDLSEDGFYDGTAFHRVSPGFVVQGGDPLSRNDTARDRWGTGGPGYTIDDEFTDIPHTRSVISMAHSSQPDSAGSQFFIVLDDSDLIRQALDGRYAAFGRVIEGMDVVDRIAALPIEGGQSELVVNADDARIISIRIIDR